MRFFIVSCTLGTMLAACDGPGGTELFGEDGAGGLAGDGGASPGSGPAGPGPSTSGPSTSGASTSSGDGGAPTTTGPGATSSVSTSTDAAVSVSSGQVTSTGPGAATTGVGGATSSASGDVVSSSAQASVSTGGDPDVVFCAGQVCSVEGDGACCWNDFNGQAQCVEGPPEQDDCQTDFGGFETRIECLKPDDCPENQICCGERDFFQQQNGQDGAWYVSVTCRFECDDVELCEPGVTDCECIGSQLLPTGTNVCTD